MGIFKRLSGTYEKELQLLHEKNQIEVKERGEKNEVDARMRSALSAVTTNIMIADADGNIEYMNESVMAMLRNAESDIRKDLPSFSANNIIGNSFDIFHKNPAHQRSMVESLTSTFKTEIVVGPRTFSLVATPCFDDGKKRIGTVVEWKDRTDEVLFDQMVERDVKGVVDSCI